MLFDSSLLPGKWKDAPAERHTVATLRDHNPLLGISRWQLNKQDLHLTFFLHNSTY
jgi:hypothetical protein